MVCWLSLSRIWWTFSFMRKCMSRWVLDLCLVPSFLALIPPFIHQSMNTVLTDIAQNMHPIQPRLPCVWLLSTNRIWVCDHSFQDATDGMEGNDRHWCRVQSWHQLTPAHTTVIKQNSCFLPKCKAAGQYLSAEPAGCLSHLYPSIDLLTWVNLNTKPVCYKLEIT